MTETQGTDAKGAQPEQLVEEARKKAEGMVSFIDRFVYRDEARRTIPPQSAEELAELTLALATALSECLRREDEAIARMDTAAKLAGGLERDDFAAAMVQAVTEARADAERELERLREALSRIGFVAGHGNNLEPTFLALRDAARAALSANTQREP